MIKPLSANKSEREKFLLVFHLMGMTLGSLNEFKVFTNVNSGIVDPKQFKKESFHY